MTKLRPYQQAAIDAIMAMDPDKPFRLAVPMRAPPFALPAPVGTHCAGCGKYREHRRGRWLCLACVVVPSRDKDVEALRQEYL